MTSEMSLAPSAIKQLLKELRPHVVKLIKGGSDANEIVNTMTGRLLLLEREDPQFFKYNVVKLITRRLQAAALSNIESNLDELLSTEDPDQKDEGGRGERESCSTDLPSVDNLQCIEDIGQRCLSLREYASMQREIVKEVRSVVAMVAEEFEQQEFVGRDSLMTQV